MLAPMLQVNIYCSLRAVHTHRGNKKGGEKTYAKLVIQHIFENSCRSDLAYCVEKIMLAENISRKTVVEMAVKYFFLKTVEKVEIR